jgi:hypothetical protein
MTDDATAAPGLIFELDAARNVFHGVAPARLVLAILATIKPPAEWTGCRVLLEATNEAAGEACVRAAGPGASEVRTGLAEAFRRAGIPVRDAATDLTAGQAELLAEVHDGAWT